MLGLDDGSNWRFMVSSVVAIILSVVYYSEHTILAYTYHVQSALQKQLLHLPHSKPSRNIQQRHLAVDGGV